MSNQYDPIYGVPFLLKNWIREQESMSFITRPPMTIRNTNLILPAMLSGEDGWPLSPDVTRNSPVASIGSGQNRRNKMKTSEGPIHFKQIKIHGVQALATDVSKVSSLLFSFIFARAYRLDSGKGFSRLLMDSYSPTGRSRIFQ